MAPAPLLVANVGDQPVASTRRLLGTLGYQAGGRAAYALEGSIFSAGSAIQWLRDGVGMISQSRQSEAMAQELSDNGGVYLVPGFTGLGAPWWEPEARGTIVGLTRDSGPAHFVRAALEALAYQTRDLLDALAEDGAPPLKTLKVDGGVTANSFAMQFVADICQVEVERPAFQEMTALGAARLAALGVGLAPDLEARPAEAPARWTPRMDKGRARTAAFRLASRGEGRHHRRAEPGLRAGRRQETRIEPTGPPMTDASSLDAQTAFSGTREVDPRYRLDNAALDAWMTEHVPGYAGPLTVRQFKGGQSNPTYELITPTAAYVLRRKPPGALLPSAHAVDREYQVISALAAQGFPVAKPHALCLDEGVIGSIFYVMDKIEGRIFWDLKLPCLTPPNGAPSMRPRPTPWLGCTPSIPPPSVWRTMARPETISRVRSGAGPNSTGPRRSNPSRPWTV